MRVEGSTKVITGSLGGGKTAHGVELAMEHLSRGGTVVTNVPIHTQAIAEWMRDEFGLVFDLNRLILLKTASIREFQDMARRGNDKNTVLMVLDEAALDLNAHDHRTLSRETFNFVVLCRKLSIDLVLIAQDANDVDKQIRQKMQQEVHCRSLRKFFSLGGLIDGPPIFVRVTYVLELGKKPWRQSAKFSWGSPAFGKYDSKALHGEKAQLFEALNRADSSELARIKYNPLPYYAVAGAATAISAVVTTLCL